MRVRYVRGPPEYGSWVVFFRSGFRECRPAVFVNVRPAPSWLLETLPTDDVQAVEVYRDPWVPGEFKQFNRCGAINIWTGRS